MGLLNNSFECLASCPGFTYSSVKYQNCLKCESMYDGGPYYSRNGNSCVSACMYYNLTAGSNYTANNTSVVCEDTSNEDYCPYLQPNVSNYQCVSTCAKYHIYKVCSDSCNATQPFVANPACTGLCSCTNICASGIFWNVPDLFGNTLPYCISSCPLPNATFVNTDNVGNPYICKACTQFILRNAANPSCVSAC